jgi:lysophospholipase L1-like esterase
LIGLKSGFFLIPTNDNCMRRSADVVMEFRPSCSGESHGTRMRTNALGFRGPELRDDASVRLLALGDSCTWGWRVSEEDSYPAVLQRLLDERAGARPYQVINAGAPGHTSYQGIRFLRGRGLALRPGIVLIGYGFNDAARSGDVEQLLARLQWALPLIRLDDTLLEHSMLYRWTRWRADQAAPQDLPVRVPLEKYRRNLTQLVGESRGSGAQVMLLVFAAGGYYQVQYRAVLDDVAAALNVPVVVYSGPRLDYVHPTAEGYHAFAERIFEALKQRGFLGG